MKPGFKPAPVEDRFWPKVDKSGNCWIWTGCITKLGYGAFKYLGEVVLAHRMSWVLANGPIPEGKRRACILHKCDNPPCVRLEHLYLGTQSENMLDAYSRGRKKAGLPWTTTLTKDDVLEIRRIEGLSHMQISKIYGVARSSISRIIGRETWRHV